jgi:hypothetical protein
MTIAPLFPILPPTGDDADLYGAWKLAEQKWQREVETIRAWSANPSERTLKARQHAESMTNEAVQLLFDAHRDAEQRKLGIQPAA